MTNHREQHTWFWCGRLCCTLPPFMSLCSRSTAATARLTSACTAARPTSGRATCAAAPLRSCSSACNTTAPCCRLETVLQQTPYIALQAQLAQLWRAVFRAPQAKHTDYEPGSLYKSKLTVLESIQTPRLPATASPEWQSQRPSARSHIWYDQCLMAGCSWQVVCPRLTVYAGLIGLTRG